MKPKDLISLITGILILFGIIFGAYQFFEKRYALAEEVKKISERLDYKIVSDQYNAVQQRIWTIQDRFQKKEMDTTTKEEMRKLEQGKDELRKKMDILEKSSQ